MGEETEGVVTNTAKLQNKLLALTGVDILEMDGNSYKSTYQIMSELADKWSELDDMSQAATLELIAGMYCLPEYVVIHIKEYI